MTILVGATLVLAAISGTLVVLSQEPLEQVFALAANGLVLGLLFTVMRAPDVALSEIAVGTEILPLLFMVALAAIAVERRRK